MALEEVILQQDNSYNFYDNEDDESLLPFYDLQSYLTFLDNQTLNYDSTFWSSFSTTFPHQSSPEIDKIVPSSCSLGGLNRCSDVNVVGCVDQVKRRRRRSRLKKNKEEIDNQRMTHIAVERNRRKQMNEYISSLRSLMPDSYVQKSDQASIVGGAINFIKDLEHRLHLQNLKHEDLSQVFKFPQFSTTSSYDSNTSASASADIEVSLVESHASLKIRTKRKPKLLLNLITGLQNLGFIILHLNVSTVSHFILCSFSTKMEDNCKLTSVADIATAVYEMLRCHQENGQL